MGTQSTPMQTTKLYLLDFEVSFIDKVAFTPLFFYLLIYKKYDKIIK